MHYIIDVWNIAHHVEELILCFPVIMKAFSRCNATRRIMDGPDF